ncbi:GyrI-like domain-containing protein [Halalkalibacter urbisdiaboli]|uniref:GyrI-like domain-containing protein n=1 Tax=Halalkalibacter urbisdiaboli TaxID=1960589 RepID=UPI000B43EA5B|nr:effector binding domain-containing protein [Halalkalibacter urbisdiaboli]
MSKVIATYSCEVVKKEFKFIGISNTAPFPSAFPEAAIKVHQDFWGIRETVPNCDNNRIIYSPFICNNIIATYFACLEVSDIQSVPEGMIGFELPSTDYAKITCTNKTIGEGYNKVFQWMGDNGYIKKGNNAFQIEVYYIEERNVEEQVEILIPIES